jgi:hypothetical protein
MTRTTSRGATVTYTAIDKYSVEVTVDGAVQGRGQLVRSMSDLYQAGYTKCVWVGPDCYPMTAAEAELLEAEISAVAGGASSQVAPMSDEAHHALVQAERLMDAAEGKRDYPAEYHQARAAAERAMQTWRETYPEAAATLDEQQQAADEQRTAERAEDLANSFVGRGVD